jgi:hypothetical protein
VSSLLDNLLIFNRVLRHAGVGTQPARVSDLVQALEYVDLGSRDEVYHACRALLVHRREEIPIFDRAFAAFWREHLAEARGTGERAEAGQDRQVGQAGQVGQVGPVGQGEQSEPSADATTGLKTWSTRSGLANKDFAAFTPDEIAAARDALSGLVWEPTRRTRRWIRGRGPRIDLRRAMARSIRTGGDVVKLPRLKRGVRPRPVVLLCDVSGSMEHYSRMLLYFAHTLSRRHRRVETFLFSTTLTRITRDLRAARPDEALATVTRSVHDWSGGTRIGRSVREFHQRWGRRALHGSPIVVIISDGWDCGEPAELAAEIARLQRSAHRLVWLNPLIGTADYAPLTRGLQAALPFVDDFLPARTLSNLADLAIHLNSIRN